MEFYELQANIPHSDDWENATHLTRGIGFDQKYRVTHKDGRKSLLRLAKPSDYDWKKRVFDLITLTWENCEISMPEPIDFGKSRDGQHVYMLLSWVEGQDFDSQIASMSEKEQYQYGYESGLIMKRIHAVPAPGERAIDCATNARQMLEESLDWYFKSPYRLSCEQEVIQFLEENQPLLEGRQTTVLHNDYHVGNFILQPDGKLGIIDFDYIKTGDSLEDTRWMLFTQSQGHTTMANGQVHGYFDGEKPTDHFFQVLNYYSALGIFGSIRFHASRNKDDAYMKNTLDMVEKRYHDSEGFRNWKLKWYQEP